MADLIRWDELPQGILAGYARGNPACLLEIYPPDPPGSAWVLQSFFPGQAHAEYPGTSADVLKDRAEELLREFASSIGAVFPGDARDDCIVLLRDKANEAGERGSLIRARMYHDAADLIAGKS